jgi:hypothetical protein
MARIALVLALLTFTVAAPAAALAPAPAPASAKKKCKKGYVRKTVKSHGKKVKRCVKKKPATHKQPANDAPTNPDADPGTGTDPGTGAGTGQPAPTEGANQTPPSSVTRNDPAGQQAISGGDLKLERAEFGASGRTATYYRVWLWQSGAYKFVQIDWNDVSGEICGKVQTGTWTFKEGYTFTEQGGGTVVKVNIALDGGGGGDDLLTFANANQNAVYVGAQGIRFDRNPNIADSC